jgi:hypothetical protein
LRMDDKVGSLRPCLSRNLLYPVHHQPQQLLRDAQAAFQEMGVARYAALAQERLDELGVGKKPASIQTQEP